jgi:hypothetical protein
MGRLLGRLAGKLQAGILVLRENGGGRQVVRLFANFGSLDASK